VTPTLVDALPRHGSEVLRSDVETLDDGTRIALVVGRA